ncbi:hypothetical protein RB195_022698 [Necator americanus]
MLFITTRTSEKSAGTSLVGMIGVDKGVDEQKRFQWNIFVISISQQEEVRIPSSADRSARLLAEYYNRRGPCGTSLESFFFALLPEPFTARISKKSFCNTFLQLVFAILVYFLSILFSATAYISIPQYIRQIHPTFEKYYEHRFPYILFYPPSTLVSSETTYLITLRKGDGPIWGNPVH